MKAFAMLSISDARLFDCVMDRVLQLLEIVSPQVGLLETWSETNLPVGPAACTTLGLHLTICPQESDCKLRPVKGFGDLLRLPQAATTFVWTCARAGHKHAALYDGVALYIMKQLQQGVEWSPSNVASVIYSCALLFCIVQHRCQAP